MHPSGHRRLTLCETTAALLVWRSLVGWGPAAAVASEPAHSTHRNAQSLYEVHFKPLNAYEGAFGAVYRQAGEGLRNSSRPLTLLQHARLPKTTVRKHCKQQYGYTWCIEACHLAMSSRCRGPVSTLATSDRYTTCALASLNRYNSFLIS